MATTNLGRIVPKNRGAHSSSIAYDKLDRVQSGASLYEAIQNVPSGIAITNTAYWECILDVTFLAVAQIGEAYPATRFSGQMFGLIKATRA